ncbi:ArsC family reductase [Sulfuriferula nivalis]|uniref:Arsenate reductase n=1 Tax=Sulfuriferula nivalis TaxID=2675298 RepID=A0A809SCX9_9PROT|nr:ArsC family reductase [Sulfuriferula nivalis]BBP00187.1 arsenate reductase [Sulfuriferula nivalis]
MPTSQNQIIQLYGIPNCTTVKKARVWLEQHQIAYQFHDFKKTGASIEQLSAWAQQAGWEKLLNRQGTTWRQLDEETKASVIDAASAIDLMHSKTSSIKRPVLMSGTTLLVGFNETEYSQLAK